MSSSEQSDRSIESKEEEEEEEEGGEWTQSHVDAFLQELRRLTPYSVMRLDEDIKEGIVRGDPQTVERIQAIIALTDVFPPYLVNEAILPYLYIEEYHTVEWAIKYHADNLLYFYMVHQRRPVTADLILLAFQYNNDEALRMFRDTYQGAMQFSVPDVIIGAAHMGRLSELSWDIGVNDLLYAFDVLLNQPVVDMEFVERYIQQAMLAETSFLYVLLKRNDSFINELLRKLHYLE